MSTQYDAAEQWMWAAGTNPNDRRSATCDALMDDGEEEHACVLKRDHDEDHECDVCGATW